MPRVKKSVASRARRKKVIAQAKGYWGIHKNTYRLAREAVQRGLKYAYRDRRQKKRELRALWITRINAAAHLCGLNYGRFINGLKKAGVEVDRKILALLAATDEGAFQHLAAVAKENL